VRRAIGVALGGIALTLLALVFGASPLFVPGVALLLIGVGAPSWVWLSARPASLARRLDVDRVVEGEPLEAMIEVRRGLLGLPGAELHDPLAGAPITMKVPMSLIQGGRVADVRIVTRFARRGLHRLQPPSLIVCDPLGLATLSKKAPGRPRELLVLPYTERVRWTAHGAGRRSQRTEGRSFAEPMAAVDVDGLRPYRPGTPASRIHWPALARGAGLLERRLRADRDTRPLVVLDARGAQRDGQLDAAVRAAASLAIELARRGGCRLLLPGERRAVAIEPDLASWPAAHARLALVESTAETKPPLLDAVSHLGQVFYVATQPLDRLPGALAAPGRGEVIVVLPKDLEARPAGSLSFEVTGCQGFVLRAPARSREVSLA
jgi:uncharacterized protein (DUF58 family)